REDVEAVHENEFVEQTLLTAGRPVLVVPSSGDFPVVGERVLYCWDGSREAARALADAAPLLRLASHLVVLTMDEGAATR
ncbi:universal stress protein, partial [Burkholderia sp. SIMBA_051]